jgi:hypothetical protein
MSLTKTCAHEIGPWPGGQQWPHCLKCEIERLRQTLERAQHQITLLLASKPTAAEPSEQPKPGDDPRPMTDDEISHDYARLRFENRDLREALEFFAELAPISKPLAQRARKALDCTVEAEALKVVVATGIGRMPAEKS